MKRVQVLFIKPKFIHNQVIEMKLSSKHRYYPKDISEIKEFVKDFSQFCLEDFPKVWFNDEEKVKELDIKDQIYGYIAHEKDKGIICCLDHILSNTERFLIILKMNKVSWSNETKKMTLNYKLSFIEKK